MWLPTRILVAALVASPSLCMSANAADELPLTLTISGPQTVTVGDTVIIHAVLKNVSKRTIEFSFGKPYTVLIHDENGEELRRKPGISGWAGSSALGEIKPGDASEDFLTSLSKYDLSVPGKYFVIFKRRLNPSDPESYILQSNEITINVTARKKDEQSNAADDLPIVLMISGPQTIAVGDQVVIRARFKNVSGHRIQIWLGKPYTLVVHDENGRELSRKPLLTSGSSSAASVEPGDILTDFGTDIRGLPVLSVPGKYVLQFTRPLDYEDPKSAIVESNEITITMTSEKRGQ